MPHPSKIHLISGLVVTAGFFVAGAYAASALSAETNVTSDLALRGGYTAAPVPRAVDPQVKPSQSRKVVQAESPTPQVRPDRDTTVRNQAKHSTAKPLANQKPLSLTIDGIRSDYGNVIVMIFADAKTFTDFDYTKAVGYAELKASVGAITAEFPELKEGPYAISLFHDENGDQQFNMSGIYPIEGYGTSNAKGKYDELSFEEALIMAGPLTVKMHYLQ